MQIPMVLIYMVQTSVSLKRVNKFMNADELNPSDVTHREDTKHAVEAENATFSWEKKGDAMLKNIDLKVNHGQTHST
jgi:ATP-binding cassette subfamily C (CFTR/MRP) protein 1